jgi:CheY-like chemotaxis protein
MTSTMNGFTHSTGGYRPNVLVIDDVKSTRDRLSRIVGAGGYGVTEASDGREALRTLTTSSIDAILLDLVMPSLNGWEFREFQLRDPRLATIPTLVITVKQLAEHECYSLRVASSTVIQKPFEDFQVMQALARALASRPRQKQEARWLSRDGNPLLWSKRGSVACEEHAPAAGSERWLAEGWTWIPHFAGKNKIEYCCQQCGQGPIRHRAGRMTVAAMSPRA